MASKNILEAIQGISGENESKNLVEAIDAAAGNLPTKSDISSVYQFKGSVANAEALPSTGQVNGDVYNIEAESTYGPAGMNVAWTGSGWDPLGSFKDVLPTVTASDEGDVLTVDNTGAWVAAAPAVELPAVTSSDEGDVLTVDSNGSWVAAAPSGNGQLAGSLTLGKGTADEVTISATQLTALLALLNQS